MRDIEMLVLAGNVFVIAVVVVWVLIAIETAHSAKKRGHAWVGWLICGLLMGPLAWCFAMSLRDYRRD